MRKLKNERGRSKGREDNYLDQSYFHVFFEVNLSYMIGVEKLFHY